LLACAGDARSGQDPDGPGRDGTETRTEALLPGSQHAGRRAFEQAFPHTNGRACATCHVLGGVPPLRMPAVNPPEKPGGRKESLSVQQKEDLLAFLRRL
jgi:hypothetical protein